MKKVLTKKHALELSVKKWQYIVENDGDYYYDELISKYPELRNLKANCGLCEKYANKLGGKYNHCFGCPLLIPNDNYDYSKMGCCQIQHPFLHYFFYKNTKENAQKVLDMLIIASVNDENKRLRRNKKEIAEHWKELGLLEQINK